VVLETALKPAMSEQRNLQ